eukprot:757527-Amphidinium_carterae.1
MNLTVHSHGAETSLRTLRPNTVRYPDLSQNTGHATIAAIEAPQKRMRILTRYAFCGSAAYVNTAHRAGTGSREPLAQALLMEGVGASRFLDAVLATLLCSEYRNKTQLNSGNGSEISDHIFTQASQPLILKVPGTAMAHKVVKYLSHFSVDKTALLIYTCRRV